MNIHINCPEAVGKSITRGTCPDCKKPTRFLNFLYEWYGADSTCIRCGRHWCDGEWMALDFYRFARRDSIARAKRNWRRLPSDSVLEEQFKESLDVPTTYTEGEV